MTCKEVVERLSEYRSGELDERTRDEITSHLRSCLSCQREWAVFQAAMNALQSVSVPEPPPELLSRIRAAVMEKRPSKPAFVWRWQWAVAVGATAIVVAIFVLPFASSLRERKTALRTPPVVVEAPSQLLPPMMLTQPSPPASAKPLQPSIKSLPSPSERIAKSQSSTFAKRHEEAKRAESGQGFKAEKPSPLEKMPALAVPSGERLMEQPGRDITSDIAPPTEQTAPKLAELPVEPRIVPFRAEAQLSERVQVPGAEMTKRTPAPQELAGHQGLPGPHGPAAAMPVIGAMRSRIETQTVPEAEQRYPAMKQQYGGFGQFGGGLGQAIFAMPFGLKWAKFEPVVVGKVRLWELALSYDSPQVVTVFVKPGEKVEILNAQQPTLGEGKGLVIWHDKLPLSREVAIPILLRANEAGTRKLLVTLETADGKNFSWWCVFPALTHEEQPRIRRPITLQIEQWTVLDLLAHLSWEGKAAFILPEQLGYRTVVVQAKAISLPEVLAMLERQLGVRWQRFGNTFTLTNPTPTPIAPMMKQ